MVQNQHLHYIAQPWSENCQMLRVISILFSLESSSPFASPCITRAVCDGPEGLIFPWINTPEQAQEAVQVRQPVQPVQLLNVLNVLNVLNPPKKSCWEEVVAHFVTIIGIYIIYVVNHWDKFTESEP